MFLTNRRNVAIAAGVLVLAARRRRSVDSQCREISITIARNRADIGRGADSCARANARSSVLRQQPIRGGESRGGESGAVNYGTVPVAGRQQESGYYPSIPPPAYVSQPQVAPPPPEPAANAYAGGHYGAGVQYAGAGRRSYREYRVHHHRRSKKHSIEIVAGTAATGAAIGAIAGGGPGAAIGAISGAGAGFVYDRLTHNR